MAACRSTPGDDPGFDGTIRADRASERGIGVSAGRSGGRIRDRRRGVSQPRRQHGPPRPRHPGRPLPLLDVGSGARHAASAAPGVPLPPADAALRPGLTRHGAAPRLCAARHVGRMGRVAARPASRRRSLDCGAGRSYLDTGHARTQLRARRPVALAFLRLVPPAMDGPVPAPHPRRHGPDATVAPGVDPRPGAGALRSERTLRPGADPRPADGVDVCVRAAEHGSPAARAAGGGGDRHLHRGAGSGAFAAGDPALPGPAPEYRGGASRRARAGGPRPPSLDPRATRRLSGPGSVRRADALLRRADVPAGVGRNRRCSREQPLSPGTGRGVPGLFRRAVLASATGPRADVWQLRLPGSHEPVRRGAGKPGARGAGAAIDPNRRGGRDRADGRCWWSPPGRSS